MAVAGCLAVVLGVVSCVVYNQVQLNELTSQIASVQTQLSEAQSVEVQLQMEASSNMTLTDVEAYAKDQLNMRKTGKIRLHISPLMKATRDRGAAQRRQRSGSDLVLLSKSAVITG